MIFFTIYAIITNFLITSIYIIKINESKGVIKLHVEENPRILAWDTEPDETTAEDIYIKFFKLKMLGLQGINY